MAATSVRRHGALALGKLGRWAAPGLGRSWDTGPAFWGHLSGSGPVPPVPSPLVMAGDRPCLPGSRSLSGHARSGRVHDLTGTGAAGRPSESPARIATPRQA